MHGIKLFRIVVACELILHIASGLVTFLPKEPLPEAVEVYLQGPGASPLSKVLQTDSISTLVAVSGLLLAFAIAYVVALVGLLLLKPWARTMYIAVFVVGLGLFPLMGPSISGPVETTVEYLLDICSGAVLAFLFVGPAHDKLIGGSPNHALERVRHA